VLFRRSRHRSAGSTSDPGSIQDRIQLLQFLEARIPCKSYLEIGTNRNRVFKLIRAPQKIGVDPHRGGTHRMTSNEFFKQNDRKFDLVFIDGLHHADQVLLDVEGSLAALNDSGVIVLHDCSPATEEAQQVPAARPGVPWNGDVWKAIVLLRGRGDIDVAVGDFDYGCGVVLARPNSRPLHVDRTIETLTYAELQAQRKDWLRLMTAAELVEFIDLP
jgi:hypothetical protein